MEFLEETGASLILQEGEEEKEPIVDELDFLTEEQREKVKTLMQVLAMEQDKAIELVTSYENQNMSVENLINKQLLS